MLHHVQVSSCARLALRVVLGCAPLILGSGVLPALTGCMPVPALPDTLEIATSATAAQAAPRDSGPPPLANSRWTIFRIADPNAPESAADEPTDRVGPYGPLLAGRALQRPPVGEPIYTLHFGAAGQMIRVSENRYFLPEFYGTDVPVGSAWSPTTLPGVGFRSASYGLAAGERFGIGVLVQVRLQNFYAGKALLYSWGTIAGDTLNGTFGYILDFRGGALDPLLDTIGDQYPIRGTRQP